MSSLSKHSQTLTANMPTQMPLGCSKCKQPSLGQKLGRALLGWQTFNETFIIWATSRTEAPELANVPRALPQPLSNPVSDPAPSTCISMKVMSGCLTLMTPSWLTSSKQICQGRKDQALGTSN